jgi:hypothetical protein
MFCLMTRGSRLVLVSRLGLRLAPCLDPQPDLEKDPLATEEIGPDVGETFLLWVLRATDRTWHVDNTRKRHCSAGLGSLRTTAGFLRRHEPGSYSGFRTPHRRLFFRGRQFEQIKKNAQIYVLGSVRIGKDSNGWVAWDSSPGEQGPGTGDSFSDLSSLSMTYLHKGEGGIFNGEQGGNLGVAVTPPLGFGGGAARLPGLGNPKTREIDDGSADLHRWWTQFAVPRSPPKETRRPAAGDDQRVAQGPAN